MLPRLVARPPADAAEERRIRRLAHALWVPKNSPADVDLQLRIRG
jgi:hypothetical protein